MKPIVAGHVVAGVGALGDSGRGRDLTNSVVDQEQAGTAGMRPPTGLPSRWLGPETKVSVVSEKEAGDPLWIEVDPTLMVQAIANVIRNAAEAMAETPDGSRTVRVRVERSIRRLPSGERGERIVIGVEDSGPGIAPEVLERMFNPFFTTRPTGTGLGLAIVHRIVEAHDGHVVVSNRDEGGATVELCVPPMTARSTP